MCRQEACFGKRASETAKRRLTIALRRSIFVLLLSGDIPSQPADLDARVERCRRVVNTLVEVGTKLLQTLDPDHGPAPVRDPLQAYCRLARSLRLTLMIEARLAALVDGGAVAMAAERRLAERAEAAPEDGPGEDGPEQSDAEEVRGDNAVERDRQDPDEISRFLSKPISEIAAMIGQDFGLSTAQAGEAQAAFAALIANDDADDPDPSGPGLPMVAQTSGQGARRGALLRSVAPLGRWPP